MQLSVTVVLALAGLGSAIQNGFYCETKSGTTVNWANSDKLTKNYCGPQISGGTIFSSAQGHDCCDLSSAAHANNFKDYCQRTTPPGGSIGAAKPCQCVPIHGCGKPPVERDLIGQGAEEDDEDDMEEEVN